MGLFGLVVWHYGLSMTSVVLVSFAALFLVVAFIDLERGLILNNIVLLGTLASFLLFPFGPVGETHGIGQAYLWSLAGGLTGFAALLILYVSFPGGIGAGDVKLAGLIGTALGLQLLLTGLLIAFAAGSLIAVFLLTSRLRTRKDALPFGPFLVGGALVVNLGLCDYNKAHGLPSQPPRAPRFAPWYSLPLGRRNHGDPDEHRRYLDLQHGLHALPLYSG